MADKHKITSPIADMLSENMTFRIKLIGATFDDLHADDIEMLRNLQHKETAPGEMIVELRDGSSVKFSQQLLTSRFNVQSKTHKNTYYSYRYFMTKYEVTTYNEHAQFHCVDGPANYTVYSCGEVDGQEYYLNGKEYKYRDWEALIPDRIAFKWRYKGSMGLGWHTPYPS